MATKILIDSASDISEKEAQQLGLTLIPIIVGFGEEEYYDGVNLLPNEFYEKLTASKSLPRTSQISIFRYEEEFEKATANGDSAVVITLSSKLSGTYNSALKASERFDGKVFIVDSLNACAGERLLGMHAINLANKGLSAQEIAKELDIIKEKIRVYATIDTLEYLKRGGRISSAVAIAGSLLSIKPVIGVIDGEVKLIGKAMGFKRGMALLNSLVEKTNGIDFSLPYGLVWSGTDESVVNDYKKVGSKLWEKNCNDIKNYVIGCTIGTHIGPGAVGIAFFEK